MDKLKELREKLLELKEECNERIIEGNKTGVSTISLYQHGQLELLNKIIGWIDDSIEPRHP